MNAAMYDYFGYDQDEKPNLSIYLNFYYSPINLQVMLSCGLSGSFEVALGLSISAGRAEALVDDRVITADS